MQEDFGELYLLSFYRSSNQCAPWKMARVSPDQHGALGSRKENGGFLTATLPPHI